MGIPLMIMTNLLDIVLVAYVFYRVILLIRGTRAIELIKGLFVLFLAFALSAQFHLNTFNWLLEKAMTMIFVALPIVFQPELRRALEQIGRGRFFGTSVFDLERSALNRMVTELTESVKILSENKIGALIVIERKVGLRDYLETGISLDARLSKELLGSIFFHKTPLHDGAVIIRQDRIMAAGCFLPLSDNPRLNPKFGTRHRAAVGITEQSDALVIVVSEETGVISLASEGTIFRYLDEISLKERLFKNLADPDDEKKDFKFHFNRRKGR